MTRNIRQGSTDRPHSGGTEEIHYQIELVGSSAAGQDVPASSSGRDLILPALKVFTHGPPEAHIASIWFPPGLLQIERVRGSSPRLSGLRSERAWRNGGFSDLRSIIDFVTHRATDLSVLTHCIGAARRYIARTSSVLEAVSLASRIRTADQRSRHQGEFTNWRPKLSAKLSELKVWPGLEMIICAVADEHGGRPSCRPECWS